MLALLLVASLHADPRCVTCHAREDAAYEKTGMAHALRPVNAVAAPPDGEFVHEVSGTKFSIHSTAAGMTQSLSRQGASATESPVFVIGSGNHALGYLVQTGDHLFQSPLAYYTVKKVWDVAPGYEADRQPDFSRPVASECLFCHAGKALPVADTLNRYQPSVFSAYGITCERCHGDVSAHLKSPVPGSILNPAKLTSAARASVCEQCHLTGEARIPNPGKAITDFRPGLALEDFYTTYIAAQSSGQSIKVVSHAEQLALSKCAIKSGDRLWCGTCHNPHQEKVDYRERCLSCHAATLDTAHAAPGRDCVACHMPKLPATDGGHTAFTNHRILRNPAAEITGAQADTLTAWREPDSYVKDRNLALALVTVGLENQSSAEVIRGYKMINRVAKDFPNDSALYTTLGLVFLKAQEPGEALKCFRRVIALKPQYAPNYVNEATALMAANQTDAAIAELQKALKLDPLLRQADFLLHQLTSQHR
jgi:tetratricopeptide (TPR) repeat protein